MGFKSDQVLVLCEELCFFFFFPWILGDLRKCFEDYGLDFSFFKFDYLRVTAILEKEEHFDKIN